MGEGNGVLPAVTPGRQYRGGGKRGRRSRKAPQLLRDLRWVYEHPEAEGTTPGQELLRKLLRERPEEFLARLSGLEQAYLAAECAGAEKAEGKPTTPNSPPPVRTVSNPKGFASLKAQTARLKKTLKAGELVKITIEDLHWLVQEIDRLTGPTAPPDEAGPSRSRLGHSS